MTSQCPITDSGWYSSCPPYSRPGHLGHCSHPARSQKGRKSGSVFLSSLLAMLCCPLPASLGVGELTTLGTDVRCLGGVLSQLKTQKCHCPLHLDGPYGEEGLRRSPDLGCLEEPVVVCCDGQVQLLAFRLLLALPSPTLGPLCFLALEKPTWLTKAKPSSAEFLFV